MIECEKTGFHAHLEPHDQWLYGDAFIVDGALLFRICSITRKPQASVKHYTIHTWSLWFDEGKTSPVQNSTMICHSKDVTGHGYEGIPI